MLQSFSLLQPGDSIFIFIIVRSQSQIKKKYKTKILKITCIIFSIKFGFPLQFRKYNKAIQLYYNRYNDLFAVWND